MNSKISLKVNVFNLTKQIPFGKITTYKIISQALLKNPFGVRVIGTALKNCPCKKKIKEGISLKNYSCDNYCYRVVKTNFNVGKFLLKEKLLNADFTHLKREKLMTR